MSEQGKHDATQHSQISDPKQLELALIEAQSQFRVRRGTKSGQSLLVMINGIELAGKGDAIKQLREWIDPRYLFVKTNKPQFLQPSQSFWQPYVWQIPKHGEIYLQFGNWYSDLIYSLLNQKHAHAIDIEKVVADMQTFEADLEANSVQVIKVWFDLDWDTLQQRLDDLDDQLLQWQKLHGMNWRSRKQFDQLQRLKQQVCDDWIVIDGKKEKQRDQDFALTILNALRKLPTVNEAKPKWSQQDILPALKHPSEQRLDKAKYKKKLKKLTKKIAKKLRKQPSKVILVFEGMDAAGKGGAIKRIIKKLDPREYDIHTIGAPEKSELKRPYLWRFWHRIPKDVSLTIFDRSWYGRVLVERLEGFATDEEWQRAYAEIQRFEQDLVENDAIVIKFWLAISKDEQLQRFESRQETPSKQFKLTDEDWRNRDKWDDYLAAATDMLHLTQDQNAPWHVIATNDKYSARIEILEALLAQLK